METWRPRSLAQKASGNTAPSPTKVPAGKTTRVQTLVDITYPPTQYSSP